MTTADLIGLGMQRLLSPAADMPPSGSAPLWAKPATRAAKKHRRNFAPSPDVPCSQAPTVAVGCSVQRRHD
jgi:hypothetical protein